VVPTPIFPSASTVKRLAPVDEATVNGLSVEVPWMNSDARPVDVPMFVVLLPVLTKKLGYVDVPTWRDP
jgi:hypothetical protein